MLKRMTGTVALLTAGLLVAGPMAAAASVEQYRAEASGAAVSLSLLDSLDLEGGLADALVASAGQRAEADGVGLSIADGSVSSAESTGATVRDPESGENCAAPAFPAPLDGIGSQMACSMAEATGGTSPAAEAEAVVGAMTLDGSLLSDLVDFLVDTLVLELTGPLDDVVAELVELGGPVLGPVVDELSEQCFDALAAITDPIIGGLVGGIDELRDAFEQDPTGLFVTLLTGIGESLELIGEALPESCAALLRLLTEPVNVSDLVQDIADILADALGDLTLLSLTLGGSTADVTTTVAEVLAEASTVALALELPSLAGLLDALTDIIVGTVTAVLDQIAEQFGEVVETLLATVDEVLDIALDLLMVPDLLSATDPLLRIAVGPATATASFDRVTGDVDTDGTAAAVTITLSSAFAEVLGLLDQGTEFSVAPGETQTILEDTPLESTITVGDTEAISRDEGDITLEGTRATGIGLALLTGVNGGIDLQVAQAEAVAGGVVGEEPAPADPALPATGGGFALLAMLMLALAGVRTNRRR